MTQQQLQKLIDFGFNKLSKEKGMDFMYRQLRYYKLEMKNNE